MLQAIFEYAKTNLGGFLSDAIILGAITFLLKLYFTNSFQKKLETHKGSVNRDLESHKGEINSQLEDVKHMQQRVYKEFDLFTTKMHEVYPELYKKIEEAYGAVTNLRGEIWAPQLEKFDPIEFEEYLNDLNGLGESEKTKLIVLFSTDKNSAIKELDSKMESVRYFKAGADYSKGHNYFIVNELYLSDDASKATRELLRHLYKYWRDLYPALNNNPHFINERLRIKELLPGVKEDFKETLKNDLRKAFSE